MCGIAGVVLSRGKVRQDDLIRMREALAHRGPDDAGLWISPDRSVGLAHRRLSVIDLSNLGRQPMANEAGTLTLVYNGELYNFAALRSQLESRGHSFFSRSDSEVLLRSYEEWGASCLQRFNGIFSFAIWDARSRTLFAARDRLGVKPLYYWRGEDGSFAFASELKSLMLVPGFNRKMDRESLWWYLLLRRVPTPRCIFEGSAQLAPGHFLMWRPHVSSLDLDCYWNAHRYTETRRFINLSVAQEELTELLRDSVKSQLVSDVPVGAFLSGGIDSSLVIALMADAGADVHSFAIGFKDQFDEAPYARTVSRLFGTTHEDMYVSATEMQQCLTDLPSIYDEPLADSSVIPTLLLSRLTRRYVKVALSGEGGDELFGGYGWYRILNRLRPVTWIPSFIRRAVVASAQALPWGRVQKTLNVLDFQDLPGLIHNVTGCWRAPELRRLMPDFNGSRPVDLQRRFLSDVPYTNQLLLHDMVTYLPDELLVKVDRASMSAGLEVRVPLLDHRVVEFALGLPPDLKIQGPLHKVMLKRILQPLLPKDLLDRPKHGFGAPLNAWLKGSLSWMIDEYLSPWRIRSRTPFDNAVVAAAVQQFRNHQASHYRIWSLIVLQMWAERYGVW